MSKYGDMALLAVKLARNGYRPDKAWKESAEEIFPNQRASREKSCPRCAFLGLAEDGLICGVELGIYTQSKRNKKYALNGVSLLRMSPELANFPNKMWSQIMGSVRKQHNNQMEVVAALWKNKDIV